MLSLSNARSALGSHDYLLESTYFILLYGSRHYTATATKSFTYSLSPLVKNVPHASKNLTLFIS